MKTQVLPVSEESIALAAKLLQQGELVALAHGNGVRNRGRRPQWGGCGGRSLRQRGRPQDNPLIVHICGMDMLHGIVSEVPERALKLAAAFWPGPADHGHAPGRGSQRGDLCRSGYGGRAYALPIRWSRQSSRPAGWPLQHRRPTFPANRARPTPRILWRIWTDACR